MRSFPIHLLVSYIFFYFLIILSVGCTSSTKEKDNSFYYETDEAKSSGKKCSLNLTDTLKIEVGTQISPLMMNGRIFTAEKSHYLSFFNNQTYNLTFFPLSPQQAKAISIEIEKEGPEGIRNVKDFFIQSMDSIFILSGRMNEKMIYLINQKGEINYKWDLNKHLSENFENYWLGHDTEIKHYRLHYNPEKKEIYFYMYNGNIIDKKTQSTYTQIALNLKNNTFREFGKLPIAFKEKSFYPMFGIGSLFSSNKVINFSPSLNDLVLYDLDSLKFIKAINLESKYSNNLIIGEDAIGYDPTIAQERDFLTESDFYTHMLTNSTGDYIYRFLKLGQSAKITNGENRDPLDLKFSVQVLDENLDLILEKDFSESQPMFFLESFAIDNKLYISFNNPLNENFSENHKQYYVYKMECN